jgi:hypothetical protein
MSIQQAHAFIRYAREHAGELPLPEEPTIAWVMEVAKGAGFDFSEAELRTAHRQDWLLRRLASGKADPPEG